MELREVLETTAACRDFAEDPVPDELLERILDTARFAPSGGNRQGWRVIVIKDPVLRRQLRDLSMLGWREYVAYLDHGLVPFSPDDAGVWQEPPFDLASARATERPNPFIDALDELPVMLVVVVDMRALAVTDAELPRLSIVGGGSIYPFVHNILLAARDVGLGGVMTTFLCRQETAARGLLALPQAFAIASLVALGVPAHPVRRLRRRPTAEFTTVDRFDGPPLTDPSTPTARAT